MKIFYQFMSWLNSSIASICSRGLKYCGEKAKEFDKKAKEINGK